MSKPTEMMYRALTRLQHGRDGERGASAIEYVGIVIIIAGIIVAIRGLGLDAQIGDGILKAVNKVLGN